MQPSHITSSEIDIMVVAYLQGNKKLISKILKALESKVEWFVTKYCYNYSYRADFRSEGVLAIYDALSKWDMNRGVKFTTYVNDYLRKYMINFMHEYVSNIITKNNHNVDVSSMKQCEVTEFNIRSSNNRVDDMIYYRAFYKYLHNEINRVFTPNKVNGFKNSKIKIIMKLKYLSHIDYVSEDISKRVGTTKQYVDMVLKQQNHYMIDIITKWRLDENK